jgi:hypothetical protein
MIEDTGFRMPDRRIDSSLNKNYLVSGIMDLVSGN